MPCTRIALISPLIIVCVLCSFFTSDSGLVSAHPSRKRLQVNGNPTAAANGTNPPAHLDSDVEIQQWKGRLGFQLLARTHKSSRIVAIGDLHGDIDAAKEIFRIAQVTNDAGHWQSGTDTVVQMGDVLDRGPHGLLIMDFLQRLRQEAHMAGGELIQLLGNHELMNYFGDFRFVHPKLAAAVGGISNYAALVQKGGKYGAIIQQLPVAVVRNGTMFVHAGMTEINVRQYGSVDDINAIMRRVLNEQDRGHPIVGEHGPVWTRTNIYSAIAQHQCGPTEHALNALSALEEQLKQQNSNSNNNHYNKNAKLGDAASGGGAAGAGFSPNTKIHRMVIGHTIMTEGEPRVFCNGALFAIDVEMSAYMPGGGYLGYYEQLQQSLEGIQPVTLFTLPRGTWQGHPPLWYPTSAENVSAPAEENAAGGQFIHPHDAGEYNTVKPLRMVAVKGDRGQDGSRTGGGGGGSGALGMFRGTILLPVLIVVLVVAVALYFVIRIRNASKRNKGPPGSHL